MCDIHLCPAAISASESELLSAVQYSLCDDCSTFAFKRHVLPPKDSNGLLSETRQVNESSPCLCSRMSMCCESKMEIPHPEDCYNLHVRYPRETGFRSPYPNPHFSLSFTTVKSGVMSVSSLHCFRLSSSR